MSDLARLRAHLDAGREVCPIDWNGFHALDGGKPILCVAARINELREEGYPVERTGTRNRCAVYTKVAVPLDTSSPIRDDESQSSSTLFDPWSPVGLWSEDAA